MVALNPLDPALNFNAFIEGDTVLTEHEMEGPLATGGDLTIRGTYEIDIQDNATFFDGDDERPSSLVVGGRIDWDDSTPDGTVPVLGNGYVKVGDLTGTDVLDTDANGASQPTRLVPAGASYDSPLHVRTVVQPSQPIDTVNSSPIDFGAAFSQMRSYSADLAACANTVTMFDAREGGSPIAKGEVAPGQQVFITLTEGRTNVLNVTGEDLNNMADLTFVNKPTADTPLLINVDTSDTGGVFDWTVPNQAGVGGVDAPYILWNFNDTTELTLLPGGATVEGSIYAPDADFTDLSISNVEGQIVAANAVLGTTSQDSGELHYYPFDATLTCESDVDPSPSATTDVPTTDVPTTDVPTTDVPTTDVPTSDAPTSGDATTEAPSSEAPTHDAPVHPDKPGTMPTTGSTLVPFGIAAAVLLAAGTAALLLSRRRSRLQ
ncbi:MAG TPA: collagen-binding domain-containing protein [Glycomyces sp.]|nr:collagen-binding domain-containing protein [Glycomyces sp.]